MDNSENEAVDPLRTDKDRRFCAHYEGRALAEGWITDPETRRRIMARLVDVATRKGVRDRTRLMAIKSIHAAEGVAQKWIEIEVKKQALEQGGNQQSILALIAEIQADAPANLPAPIDAEYREASGPVALELADDGLSG